MYYNNELKIRNLMNQNIAFNNASKFILIDFLTVNVYFINLKARGLISKSIYL